MNNLLAKSYDKKLYPGAPPAYALLTQHSRDVAEASNALASAIGERCLRNAQIERFSDADLKLALKANGWLQDIGKANSHFQQMLKTPDLIQLLRHETISAFLAWKTQLREWFSTLPPEVFVAAVWGAVGHHRKFELDTKPKDALSLSVLWTHPDFQEILDEIANDLGLPPAPPRHGDLVISKTGGAANEISAVRTINELKDDFEDIAQALQSTCKSRFIACVKALGICADVAASALAKGHGSNDYSLADFVRETVVEIGLTPEDIEALIKRRTSGTATKIPPPAIAKQKFEFRPFQLEVGDSTSRLTLASAGCGAGKSLAAYLWANKWCHLAKKEGRKNFRFFFCLPTTGTTTEHFRDYALESGIDASLTHSRSRVDLRTIAETVWQEEGQEGSGASEAARECLRSMRDKIEALSLWSTPLVVSTADTVLGLMSNARRSICSFPAIMSAAIVFDEVHAFDAQLFGHLLVFLKNFPELPVLLMTASLPVERKRALNLVRPDLMIIEGPPEFESLPRYVITREQSRVHTQQLAAECIKGGGKVLWVKNRVDWANQVFHNCRKSLGNEADVFVYHSRFKYRDRSRRHRRVIDNFKQRARPSVLVSTQVAEMSLDLSADLLITDEAPIAALIQRMGRVNRYARPDSQGEPKRVVVVPVSHNDALPYSAEELGRTRRWIETLIGTGKQGLGASPDETCGAPSVASTLCLDGKALSQRDLVEAFSSIAGSEEIDMEDADERALFFSGLWQTRPGLTREEGHTISIVLEKDVSAMQAVGKSEPSRDWIREHEVSIPYRDKVRQWKRLGYLPIAPTNCIAYDFDERTEEGTGATWL